MERNGYTQRDLARLCGVSQQLVSRVLRQLGRPTGWVDRIVLLTKGEITADDFKTPLELEKDAKIRERLGSSEASNSDAG